MTYQSPSDMRQNVPGHISTVSVDQTNLNGNHGPRRTEPHGLCVCETVTVMSPWGECQRCFKPVVTSVSRKVLADAALREPYV